MKSLLSNPYTALMAVAALILSARLFFVLMDELRDRGGYAATFRPSWRRRAAGQSREFQSAGADGRALLQLSRTLETWIDRETDEAGGRVVAGPYRGRGLETLSRTDCLRLNEYCLRSDPEAARLFESYMKARLLRGASRAKPAKPEKRRRVYLEGAMTRQHAHEVLGLAEGANEREIVKAHRALTEKLKPDRDRAAGAALIDQARDLLLR
jgi:hypothetical protein